MPVSLSRSTLFNTILKTPAAPPCTQTRYEHATIFWLRAMASDLEVLILILTRSHQCELDVTAWWSQQDHIIRKKLRQGLGLCLCNLLCLKFSLINRISGEKAALVESNFHRNGADLLPAMQTKLSLQSYRNWIAQNNRQTTIISKVQAKRNPDCCLDHIICLLSMWKNSSSTLNTS